jgi:hypothetical protein
MGRVINVGDEAYGKGGDFKPIPMGTKVQATVFAIDEVPVKSGPNAGKSQLDLTFKVQGGEFNGREIRYQKVPLYDGPGAWKLVTFAEAVGWPHKPVSLPDNLQSVLGTVLTIKVNEKAPDSQGRIFNEVGGYAKATGEAGSVNTDAAAPSWGALNS